jgi:phage terminase large subunit-like protein
MMDSIAEVCPIIEYYEKIEAGEITVCKKIRILYAKLAADVYAGKWDLKKANRAITFIEKFCRHSKGKLRGKRIVLELWEKALIATIFGFVDLEGNRQYRRALLIIGKKNGKSLLLSAIGIYMMIADGEGGAEVYSVATKKDQAKIVWNEAVKMVKQSPLLLKKIAIRVAEMRADFNLSIFKPLSSNVNTIDGLNVSCALMDEIHQWVRGWLLYNIVADGTIARDEPLILIASTAGPIREDIYDDLYDLATAILKGYEDPEDIKAVFDDRFIAFIYEIDSREEWQDPEAWIKANPGLGTIKKLDQLREKVEIAKQRPATLKNLLCKEFNYRETAGAAWLPFDVINNEMQWGYEEFEGRRLCGIAGADLSDVTDLTAACVIFKIAGSKKIYVDAMAWIPQDKVEKHIHDDKIRYDIWIEKGYCRTCAGNQVDTSDVVEWLLEVHKRVQILYIGYDRYGSKPFVKEASEWFGKNALIPIAQGPITLSLPMKQLGAELEERNINYNDNPIMKWCTYNVEALTDSNGNIKPKKANGATQRIDVFASLLDAYVILQDKRAEYDDML